MSETDRTHLPAAAGQVAQAYPDLWRAFAALTWVEDITGPGARRHARGA
jgi:hypothetical protein